MRCNSRLSQSQTIFQHIINIRRRPQGFCLYQPVQHTTDIVITCSNTDTPWIVKRPRFILFGDSLTERSNDMGGWGSSLAHHYYRKVDVINRGFGGYNTQWALYLLDEIFGDCTSKNTALVTLFFGANDAARPLPDGNQHSSRQHVTVDEYMENMKRIIGVIRSKGVENIIMMTPPPVYEPSRKEWQRQKMGLDAESMELDRTNNFTKQYAEACKAVAKEMNLPVIDLWTSMQQESDWGTKLFSDGLHFTTDGNQHVFKNLKKVINDTYSNLRAEVMPLQFPPWDAFNGGPNALAYGQPPKQ